MVTFYLWHEMLLFHLWRDLKFPFEMNIFMFLKEGSFKEKMLCNWQHRWYPSCKKKKNYKEECEGPKRMKCLSVKCFSQPLLNKKDH